MNVAFVGIEKDWDDLQRRDYVEKFVKYHLELPWYYASLGKNTVFVVTDRDVKIKYADIVSFANGGSVQVVSKETFSRYRNFDVVVHWRKWFEDLHRPEAINVINSQDHSYGFGWLKAVEKATKEGKLYGILCFPTWHQENLEWELSGLTHRPSLLSGVTLGVDTDIYRPAPVKSPYDLLWASDIGRGLNGAVELALKLFQKDKRYKLHICWPDYTNGGHIMNHPALKFHMNLDNGPELWNLFNSCGFLPYTCTFKEPSSRAHRQAMAAGCVVLYPPDMGSPSRLIRSGVDGFVLDVKYWVDTIVEYTNDTSPRMYVSCNARNLALAENWEVQSRRFNELFERILKDGKY